MTHKLGGPSVFPPVPQNVLDYNFTYPAYWKPAEGPERYRRSLYVFRKRSMPDPVMANFDAPERRLRLRPPRAVEHAAGGADRPERADLRRSGPGAGAARAARRRRDDAERADYAFLLCTSRRRRPAERDDDAGAACSRAGSGWPTAG